MALTKPVPDLTSIQHYTRVKQTIAGEIRALADLLRKHPGDREAEECPRLMAKLAEDQFLLAVVGQFKRGKSSLMNAIIGRNILPAGVLPLTSAITSLKYGPRDKLTILREGVSFSEEKPISSIADYVTEKGNPGNKEKVSCAVLELPVEFLRGGLEFIDTPGIGSAIEANTATTYDFLPHCDAVIFVTSVDTPLTRAEIDFLRSIREHVRKIFFVVNKIDLAMDSERQEIMTFISRTLKRETQAEELRIFPVSSAIALNSSVPGKEDGYEESGVKTLQEALSDFLTNEKSRVLLVSVLDKVLSLAKTASSRIRLFKVAGQVSRDEVQRRTAALAERFQSLRETRQRLLIEIRERTTMWAEERISSDVNSCLTAETRVLVENLDKILLKSRWMPSFRLGQDFSEHALERLTLRVDECATRLTTRFSVELFQKLHDECALIEQQLHGISVSAREIFEAKDADVDRGEQSLDPPPRDEMPYRPTSAKIKWDTPIPFPWSFLPVFAVRSRTRRHLRTRLYALAGLCERQLEDELMRVTHHALDAIDSDMEKRAEEIESRIIRSLDGKQLSQGIDGHLQVVQLDVGELDGEIEMLAGIERKLGSIRTRMFETSPTASEEPSVELEIQPAEELLHATSEQESQEQLIRSAAGTENRTDFPRDLKTRGCAVCNRMIVVASHFFADRQYALATRESARQAYAATHGFCPPHTWQLEAMASPHGLSIGFSTFMERLSADLGKLAASARSNPGESVPALFQDPAHCEVCRIVGGAEREYLKGLAEFAQREQGQKAYVYSQGVCLRHLGMLIAEISSEKVVGFLLEHAARRFLEISEDMRNYALKRDALRGHMQTTDEKDAYLRGLIHTVGAKRVCFPWESDV